MFEFDIINHVMDNSDKKEFASLIHETQRMHEDSFDGSKYNLSIPRCARESFDDLDCTLDRFWCSICANLVTFQWNESFDFCEEVLGE